MIDMFLRVVTPVIACRISRNLKLPSPIQCHIGAVSDWHAGITAVWHHSIANDTPNELVAINGTN